ncbi:MAG: ABC transporter ATP-binding protein [Candidatus Nanoarchaeia archaeon]
MNAIELENVNKIYKGGFQALKNINLTIEKGDFFALLGPNGAGKSTTIGLLCSLVNKTSGTIKVCGFDIDKDFNRAKSHLGVVPQEVNLSIFETVEQIVLNQAGYYGISRKIAKQRLDPILENLGLLNKKHEQVRMLSGGMKRRVMIARALIHEPEVLVLDEPTAGVDVELRHTMWEYINKLHESGITIILTTHYLEEAEELAKHVAIINKGEVIENTTIKNLLRQIDKEIYVVESRDPLPKGLSLKEFDLKIRDDITFEVTLDKNQSINKVVKELDDKGVSIVSLRTKQNRLEALFIQKTADDDNNKGGDEK